MSPADVMGLFLRRLPSIVFVTVVVTAAAIGAAIAWPNQYGSDGLFYVRLGRSAVAADPTAQASETVSVQDSRAAEVASVTEMLMSREIADRVVRQVGAEQLNAPRNWLDRFEVRVGEWLNPEDAAGSIPVPTAQDAHDDTILASAADQPIDQSIDQHLVSVVSLSDTPSTLASDNGVIDARAQLEHEKAIRKLKDNVNVEASEKGFTISVHSKLSDPFLAQAVTQAYLDQYGALHVSAHETPGSYNFFEQQTEISRSEAIQAQRELQNRRNELGWMSFDRAEEALQLRIVEVQTALDSTVGQHAEAIRQAEALREDLKTVEPWIPVEVARVANEAADDIKAALYDVQVDEGERMSRVTPNHPRYRILKRKLEQGESLSSVELPEREESREAINPVHQELTRELQTAEARVAGLAARKESLASSLDEANKQLAKLNHDAIELAELDWKAQIAQRNYVNGTESLESARLIRELDRQQLSDVTVIQPASLNLKKVGPPRAALAIVGLLAGGCLGLVQALVRPAPRSRRRIGRGSAADHAPHPIGPRSRPVEAGPINHPRRRETELVETTGGRNTPR